jgi:hypothetical protein
MFNVFTQNTWIQFSKLEAEVGKKKIMQVKQGLFFIQINDRYIWSCVNSIKRRSDSLFLQFIY